MKQITGGIARLWKLIQGIGLERFELRPSDDGWILRGVILRVHERIPVETSYSICCDARWETVSAEIRLLDDAGERRLVVDAYKGKWLANGKSLPLPIHCVDIDLGWSPSTNTLPIRRLNLSVGAEREAVAAWVRFPELSVEPLDQQYKRLAHHAYLYSSDAGAFTAEIQVDDYGLVEEYKEGWKRMDGMA